MYGVDPRGTGIGMLIVDGADGALQIQAYPFRMIS